MVEEYGAHCRSIHKTNITDYRAKHAHNVNDKNDENDENDRLTNAQDLDRNRISLYHVDSS